MIRFDWREFRWVPKTSLGGDILRAFDAAAFTLMWTAVIYSVWSTEERGVLVWAVPMMASTGWAYLYVCHTKEANILEFREKYE